MAADLWHDKKEALLTSTNSKVDGVPQHNIAAVGSTTFTQVIWIWIKATEQNIKSWPAAFAS